MSLFTPTSIFDISSKTRALILKRLDKGCSNCGWKEAACDLHHIIPTSKGGTNIHANLTVLCPNCHRLAHAQKLIKFINFEQQFGNEWIRFYDSRKTRKSLRKKSLSGS